MYPGKELRAVDQQLVDQGDLAACFKTPRAREFSSAGTALAGGVHPP